MQGGGYFGGAGCSFANIPGPSCRLQLPGAVGAAAPVSPAGAVARASVPRADVGAPEGGFVQPEVAAQVGGAEDLAALGARLLRVGAFVGPQPGPVAEGLAAADAHEGLRVAVLQLVDPQRRGVPEGPAALLALERLGPGVRSRRVATQGRDGREGLAARTALVEPRPAAAPQVAPVRPGIREEPPAALAQHRLWAFHGRPLSSWS